MEKEDIKIVNISKYCMHAETRTMVFAWFSHEPSTQGGDDIAGGRLKLILGLLWTLIQKYQLSEEEKNLKDELLKWVQSGCMEYSCIKLMFQALS